MKHTIAILLLPLLLLGCAAPNAGVTFGDPANPNRITGITGLESRDAANIVNQSGYYDAVKNKPNKAIVSIKAQKGQVVSISGLDEFIVWAPSSGDDAVIPLQTKSAFAENVEAVGNATSNVLGAALPVVGVVQAGKVLKSGFDASSKDPVQVPTQIVEPTVIQVPAGSSLLTP